MNISQHIMKNCNEIYVIIKKDLCAHKSSHVSVFWYLFEREGGAGRGGKDIF